MIGASARFKQNAKAPVKTVQMRMAQVVSEGETPVVYSSADLIKSVKVEASSTWLYSGAKKAAVTLVDTIQGLDNYTWVLELGIVDPGTSEIDYITLGTFSTDKVVISYEKGTTTLSVYDYMDKAEKAWQDNTHVNYPKTVEALSTGIANNIGCAGLVSMTGLPNIDKIVQEDLWALISQEKYRDVINEIANVTASTAIVNYENKLKFVPFTMPVETLTYDNLRSYKLGLPYGRVNSVVLSRQPQNDDVAQSDDVSIQEDGLTEVKIVNNEIADDDRPSFVTPIFNALNGVSFDGIEMDTEGHGWYEIGDSLQVIGGEGSRLPSGYQEVAFLESTGTQYIDTGYIHQSEDEIEITISPLEASSDKSLFGSYESSGGTTAVCELGTLSSQFRGNIGAAGSGVNYTVGQVYTVKCSSGVWSLDGVEFGWSNTNDSTVTSFVFGRNYGTNWKESAARLYSLRVKRNGSVIHHYVPCVRVSDTVAGLYDMKTDVFHTNSGTGSFRVGANAQHTVVVVTDYTLTLDGGGFKENIKCVTPNLTSTDYTATGGIKKSIYNTEIKTDKQQQEITSIVSRQDTFEDQVNEEFTQVHQDIAGLTVSVQTTGGGNYIKNSAGYSTDSNGNLVNWTFAGSGSFSSQTSPESMQAGAISGNQISLLNGTLTQRVILAPDLTYVMSYIGKKSLVGVAGIRLVNDNEQFDVLMPDQTPVYWEKQEVTFTPTLGYVDVVITADATVTEFAITDLMLAQGDLSTPWRQADGEILNTQVAVDTEGIRVKSSVYEGDETVMTPLEFAGYSSVSGTKTKVFSLNRDTTEVQKISVQQQISMPPLKVIPLSSPSGWAFVKGEN